MKYTAFLMMIVCLVLAAVFGVVGALGLATDLAPVKAYAALSVCACFLVVGWDAACAFDRLNPEG